MKIYQRAENLLTIHNGSCSIAKEHELEPAFQQMKSLGLVTITDSSTPGMLDIRRAVK